MEQICEIGILLGIIKRKIKKKVKQLKYEIKIGNLTSKEAKKYLAGHLGYIQIANVQNLTQKLFYCE